jgi:hypothetical protein
MEKVAIICPIKDENTFIHKFFEYYCQHLDKKDIYILDFGSSEEYINDVILPNANVIRTKASILDAPGVFNEIKKNMVLLKSEGYDFVIPLDVDEILYYHEEGGLKGFLQGLTKSHGIVTCRGYEVIHIPTLQEDLKQDEQWAPQIKYWYPEQQHYGKTLISRSQLDWGIGFHKYKINDVWEKDWYVDDRLFLIHMHKIDFKTTIERHQKWSSMIWSDETIKNGYNYHYRMTERQKIIDWYFEPILSHIVYEMPEVIKNNIKI